MQSMSAQAWEEATPAQSFKNMEQAYSARARDYARREQWRGRSWNGGGIPRTRLLREHLLGKVQVNG